MPEIIRLCAHASTSPAAVRAWRVLLLVLVAVVSFLALTPQPPPEFDLGWDKLNHMAAFTALAFAAIMSFPTSRRWQLSLLAAVFVLGGLIEIGQLFVPGRSSEWADLLADSVGIACGALAAAAWVWVVSTAPASPG